MADIKGTPDGVYGVTNQYFHDESDGTHAGAVASHLRYWNTATLVWEKASGTAGAISTTPTSGGAVTVADGADATQGAIADAAVTGDVAGTVNSHLRGVTKQLAGTLTTSLSGTVPVTQSTSPWLTSITGTVTTQTSLSGTVPVTQTTTPWLTSQSGTSQTSIAGTVTVAQASPPWSTNQVSLSGSGAGLASTGNSAAGTQRVVIATDQPVLTNPLPTSISGTVQAQGLVSDTQSSAGNPVPVGAVYESAPPVYTAGQRSTLHTGTRGALRVELYSADTTTNLGGSTFSEGVSNAGTGLLAAARGMVFNETTWDRHRGNTDTTTGDTGVKSANFTGATQTNYNARGAIITCLLGVTTGTYTTFQTGIQWSPNAGTTWLGLTPLGANLTTPSNGNTFSWFIYPTNWSQAAGTTPANIVANSAATQVNFINAALPRTWRWIANIAGTTPSMTLTSVNVNYIL